jgi:NhaP-type Na+/H+ and K+/H+ antiporter
MVITILAEPRSGSSNLLYWFGRSPNYTMAFEPIMNPFFFKKKSSKNLTYNNLNDINSYKYNTSHLVIKEIANITEYHNTILHNSDKVIVLFREDYKKQLESFILAYNTDNWFGQYMYDEKHVVTQEQSALNKSKEQIEAYKSKYFSISYEDLYYRGKIKELVDYIGDSELNSIPFPYGKKYRIDKKTII